MLLYPSMPDLLKKIHNRYMLVNVVATRARQIAEKAEETQEHSEVKAVSEAVKEIADGTLTITINQEN